MPKITRLMIRAASASENVSSPKSTMWSNSSPPYTSRNEMERVLVLKALDERHGELAVQSPQNVDPEKAC